MLDASGKIYGDVFLEIGEMDEMGRVELVDGTRRVEEVDGRGGLITYREI